MNWRMNGWMNKFEINAHAAGADLTSVSRHHWPLCDLSSLGAPCIMTPLIFYHICFKDQHIPVYVGTWANVEGIQIALETVSWSPSTQIKVDLGKYTQIWHTWLQFNSALFIQHHFTATIASRCFIVWRPYNIGIHYSQHLKCPQNPSYCWLNPLMWI